MDCVTPDTEVLRAALDSAVRAPSVHNTQPWRWRVTGDGIQLFADPARQLTVSDPSGRALLTSCGAALHHLRVALAAKGWKSAVEYFPTPRLPELLATVRTAPYVPTDADRALAAAIPRRRTDRRRYVDAPIPYTRLRALATQVSARGAAVRQVPETLLDELAVPMGHAVAQHATDLDYQAELARWSGPDRTVDGVPSAHAPGPRGPGEIPLRTFAAPDLADPTTGPDAAHWLVVGTPHDDQPAQLRAGEATSALLLTATGLGLATSVQTEPLDMRSSRGEIRYGLLHECAHPQVVVRVGRAPQVPLPLLDTPRRPLDEVLEV